MKCKINIKPSMYFKVRANICRSAAAMDLCEGSPSYPQGVPAIAEAFIWRGQNSRNVRYRVIVHE